MRTNLSNLTEHQKKYRRNLKGRLWRKKNPQSVTQKQDRENNPEKYKIIRRRTYLKNRDKSLESNNDRHRMIVRSRSMLDESQLGVINQIYLYSERISKCTGIKHNVDHVFPLSSKSFSALHVPWNLRVITSIANSRKGNQV